MKYREIVDALFAQPVITRNIVELVKRNWAGKYKCSFPLNSEILAAATKEEKAKLKQFLITKPTRTISGVSTIALMTKPAGCVGRCTYCPTSTIAPKSYTGYEPSTMRARRNNFDSYLIVKNRLKQLEAVGHPTDKCEVIIQGGTFTWMPWDYQYTFVKRAFDAFNDVDAKNLAEAQKINETAKHRVVALIIETRPDWCKPEHIEKMLQLGATRVELGLQSTYDDVLEKIKRGHDLQECKRAIKDLKNAGFKVDLHMMLGLPGSTKEKDIGMFETLFTDEDLRPDGLKIYPCGVIKGSEIYEQWKRGEYKSINDQYIVDVLTEVKAKYIPKYVRIKRIMRDIPSTHVEAGYKYLNLREFIQKRLKENSEKCRCIRCREVGHKFWKQKVLPENLQIITTEYGASDGKEFFISIEDINKDILLGFARLRLAKKAFLRELHVFGQEVPINFAADKTATQHRGFGKKLLATAEEIARQNGAKELFVLAGVGVKEYYEKLGYEPKGYYVIKVL